MKKLLTVVIVILVLFAGLTSCMSAGTQEDTDNMKWWQKTNVYEIYVNSFQDSDGDGYGDLKGITERLDYLQELGIGAVWLTPVFASPMDDNGYDVADYYEINPIYGTNEDMDKLLEEADKRGIRIVMDLVFNHTSSQNKWFIESSKSTDNEYSDWYIWRDAKADGSPPNNWRSIFGGSAWTWSDTRHQYYLHTFAESQPDLNWENPDVRQALYDVSNYWADKGVGGFRLDAIPYIRKPDDYSDGEPDEQDGSVSIHDMTANTEGILDYLAEFKRKVQEGRDIFTVGEANGVPASELDKWVGREGVFDMIFEFSHINIEFDGAEVWCEAKDWKLTDLKKALSDSQRATAANGWYPIFFENHDKPRSIDHYFPEDANPVLAGRAMGTVLMTLRGTPFLYQGEELGYKNIKWTDIDEYNDINSLNQYNTAVAKGYSKDEAMAFVHKYSRDNARTPMQWNNEPGAGFTDGEPWLPTHEEYRTENAEYEAGDPASVLSWYRALARFRQDNEVLISGDYKEILSDSEQIYAFIRENENQKLIIAVNFTGDEVSLDLTEAGISEKDDADILISSYKDIVSDEEPAGLLRPYEAVVIEADQKGTKGSAKPEQGTQAAKEVHVAAEGSDTDGDGTENAPYATVSRAAKEEPGSLIIVHGGDYGPVKLGADCSGSEASPTIIRAAGGEHAVIHAKDGSGISLTDTSFISVEGIETVGGQYGIEYKSTRNAGEKPLTDISIRDCKVHGVRGVHGICVYGCNDLAPVKNLVIEGCEVYDCECGSSESVVLNGNIDGFLIAGNTIHDNNNIGIDMIGFEGTAKHPEEDDGRNPYEVDQARNGICRDNVVFNISTDNNPAYYEDGEYDLCAGGIYVDGGRNIEISGNYIYNCDIGLEAATEHRPEDNDLFRVSGIRVHDNVIADCQGYAGICFGGYDKDLGFTEECEFDHNTLVDNAAQIGVQRSKNNRVYANLIIGGETGVEFSEECRKEDMVNDISGNIVTEIKDEDSWTDTYGQVYAERGEVADGFRSLVEGCGSRFIPDESQGAQ